jgi:hypothetical protein
MLESGFNSLIDRARNRRKFLKGAGLAALAAVAVPRLVTDSRAATMGSSLTTTDVEVLNFALQLEYLEAEFYLRVATGSGLPADLTQGSGTLGTVTGGHRTSFANARLAAFAQELAEEEMQHVADIRALLTGNGAEPVAEPSIDFEQSFTTLAVAAGLIQQGQHFGAFADDMNFLLAAYIFEDVGVTAYNGAAGSVSATVLPYAASIMAVEAYHAGAIRMLAFMNGQAPATKAISTLRATLDGTVNTDSQDDFGVHVDDKARIADAGASTGLAFSRTTNQVLSIVFGSTINSDGSLSATSGLFYPDGINGPAA